MTKFTVFYYDAPIGIIYAPDHKAAVVALGYRYGGQVGISCKIAT